jgi:hypothetical protein
MISTIIAVIYTELYIAVLLYYNYIIIIQYKQIKSDIHIVKLF